MLNQGDYNNAISLHFLDLLHNNLGFMVSFVQNMLVKVARKLENLLTQSKFLVEYFFRF